MIQTQKSKKEPSGGEPEGRTSLGFLFCRLALFLKQLQSFFRVRIAAGGEVIFDDVFFRAEQGFFVFVDLK